MEAPKLSENMSKSLISVRWNSSLYEASVLMEEKHIRHLPVVDSDGFVVGILSDRDVMRALDPQRPIFRDGLIVGDYMSWPVIQVDEGASVEEVAEAMIQEKVSAFLVCREEQLIGIVTSEDLLKVLAQVLRKNKKSRLKISQLRYEPVLEEVVRDMNLIGL